MTPEHKALVEEYKKYARAAHQLLSRVDNEKLKEIHGDLYLAYHKSFAMGQIRCFVQDLENLEN